MPQCRVGTASWTDPTLIESGRFYPPQVRTAEARLRYYARHFDLVEVDSTYYALPAERNASLWVERTPPGFCFIVKAFSLLTGHPCEAARLPRSLRKMLAPTSRGSGRVWRPPERLREGAFAMFGSALAPLRRASKLGCILFQFPPWFAPSPENYRYIAECQRRLPEDALAVEFRHPRWVTGPRQQYTFDFLREHGLIYVAVDEPASPRTLPPVCVTTAADGYVRFHGRDRDAWFARGRTAAERFRYRYGRDELVEWADRIRRLVEARVVYVVFNNCYADYAIDNARTMRELLAEE